MSFSSAIPPDLIQAYNETGFRILGLQGFTLRIGSFSNELLVSHKCNRVDCSAFLTACNPYSKELTDKANQERQQELARLLSTRGLKFDEGIGQHLSNQWPGEPSFLVYGLNLESAKKLGAQFEQNAIVWSGADGVPQLVLLR